MRIWKRGTALLAALVLSLSLCACGNSGPSDPPERLVIVKEWYYSDQKEYGVFASTVIPMRRRSLPISGFLIRMLPGTCIIPARLE